MNAPKIGLAEAIENLRQELKEATEQGKDQELRLLVDGIELELEIEISKEGGSQGKVSFNLFGSGAEVGVAGQMGKTRAHRIKLSLRPKPPGGEGAYEMGDAVPARRGAAEEG